MKQRIAWVVGDIHGCFHALLALEQKIGRAAARAGHDPLVVSVGDLVDRGPGSRQVVETFLQGTARGTHQAIAGNHEALMLRTLYEERPDLFAAAGVSLPGWVEPFQVAIERLPAYRAMAPMQDWAVYFRLMWLSQGGAETLASYGCDASDPGSWGAVPGEHLRYLASLPLIWECASVVVTHALVSRTDLEDLRAGGDIEPSVARRAIWSRALPPEPPDPTRPHVSGHTVLKRVRRYPSRNLVRLDLGSYLQGQLAAWCPALDRTVAVRSEVSWRRGG